MILKTICLIGECILKITVGLIRWFDSWKDILNLRGNSFLRSMMIDTLYFVVHSTTQLMQVSIDHFFWIYFVLTLLLWITILLNKIYQRYSILIRSSMFTYLFLQLFYLSFESQLPTDNIPFMPFLLFKHLSSLPSIHIIFSFVISNPDLI